MSRSLQNRLKQHEETPPSSAWESISRRLDAEFVPSDLELSSKLQNAGIPPPAPAWEAISSALASPSTERTPLSITAASIPAAVSGTTKPRKDHIDAPPAPVRRLPALPRLVRNVAAAAAIIAAIALGAVYLLPEEGTEKKPTSLVVAPDRQERPLIAPADQKASDPSGSSLQAIAAAPDPSPTTHPRSQKPAHSSPPPPVYEFQGDIEQANPQAVQTVSQIVPVTVSAPPIRDEDGNLIMDLQVISDPGQPYIVVTGPNGDQTRISRKFLHYLSYLNSDYSYTEMNSEERQWKNRFEEWRNELLREASFIPTANNFFDIFQLKELIEDR